MLSYYFSYNLFFKNIFINGTTNIAIYGNYNKGYVENDIMINAGYYHTVDLIKKLENVFKMGSISFTNNETFTFNDLKVTDRILINISNK